ANASQLSLLIRALTIFSWAENYYCDTADNLRFLPPVILIQLLPLSTTLKETAEFPFLNDRLRRN
ncbi:MAG: hypothetical protein ABI659_02600, partial [Nitrosospira sp.]